MRTKKVYFDVPGKRSTVLLGVTLSSDINELTANVSHMMGAKAVAVSRKEYLAKKSQYEKAE